MEAPPEPDRLLHHGDTLEIGDLKLHVLHTPGHSPGSICLEGNGVIFTGDTLLKGNIGRTDLPGGNFNELLESICTRLMPFPDNTIILPGHGLQSTLGAERERFDLSTR